MQPVFNSINKKQLDSAYSSEDQNRSTVKRLFSSVFSIIDNDHQVTDFSQDHNNKSKILKLLQNQYFVSHLQNKLRNQGFFDGYNLPILIFSVKKKTSNMMFNGFAQHSELDETDLSKIFQKFGQLHKIVLRNYNKIAYVFFSSFLNAYIAYKFLNNAVLRGGSFQIGMQWVSNNDRNMQINGQIVNFLGQLTWQSLFQNKCRDASAHHPFYPEESGNTSNKQSKLTCRYDIQIQNQREFQVARRIIGSKGCHMKRILEESIASNNENKNCSNENLNELLKLRLRGRGSGYKEGPEQQQSNQNLHLCVSAKDQMVYSNACERVEALLESIYNDYVEFTRKQGRATYISVKKSIIGQNNAVQEQIGQNYQKTNDCCDYQGQGYEAISSALMYAITPQKISELLELRNKARRQLNFNEADRIRNYLRNCGVCLIDEKGRRGKATQVTTWKYIY